MSRAYELDAEAFAKPPLERADAFDVVGDALDEEGLHAEAATRRSWAQTMRECLVVDWRGIPHALDARPYTGASGPIPGDLAAERTARLIRQVVAHAVAGESVVIVTRSVREAERLDELALRECIAQVRQLMSGRALILEPHAIWRRIHVETAEGLSFQVRGFGRDAQWFSGTHDDDEIARLVELRRDEVARRRAFAPPIRWMRR